MGDSEEQNAKWTLRQESMKKNRIFSNLQIVQHARERGDSFVRKEMFGKVGKSRIVEYFLESDFYFYR